MRHRCGTQSVTIATREHILGNLQAVYVPFAILALKKGALERRCEAVSHHKMSERKKTSL